MSNKRIKTQKVRVILSHKDSSRGEHSPYWAYTNARWDSNSEEGGMEPLQANPDSLPETVSEPSTPQLLMGEAINHLQGRQKEVYLLTMREDKSVAEAAEVLKISKGTAQKYKERAIRFIESYCREAIRKGRV